MPDITDPAPISPLTSAVDQHRRENEKKRQKDKHPEPPSVLENISDETLIMGIPAEEVTPKVQEAISLIMNELDNLRQQLICANDHIVYLEELSEKHSFLPLMNHRGLLRELSRIIALGERSQTSNSFLCLHIRNIEHIRAQHGHRAVKSLLVMVAEMLNKILLTTDISGGMGGNDIGIILTVADADEANKKAKQLLKSIKQQVFTWKGNTINLDAVCGIHVLAAGESAEDVMDRADENLSIGIISGDDVG